MLFLSTPSARRATGCSTTTTPSQTYFYPRPPRGGRLETVKTTITGCYFYPRPPRGGRPLHPAMMVCSLISIHALREEGDATGRHHGTAATDFYPRPPRGGRLNFKITVHFRRRFLSTPSARRATPKLLPVSRNDPISIHALREEGDRIPRRESNQRADFYPRPPRGGRRAAPVPCYSHGRFLSTPSARRATRHKPALPCPRGNFYPRPPRGGRRCRLSGHRGDHTISIHALREEGDVGRVKDDIKPNQISIHALREEGDSSPEGERGIPLDFYPRPPRGGRRSAVEAVKGGLQFLSTPSARRATTAPLWVLSPPAYFYPRPPRGGRRKQQSDR